MKTVITMLLFVVAAVMTATAQDLTFDENTIVTGSLGSFSSPDPAGVALKATYPDIFDSWGGGQGFQLEIVNINSQYPFQIPQFGNVFHMQLPTGAGHVRMGPLQAGGFAFTLIYSSSHPNNSPSRGTCYISVFDANMNQVGVTESWQATSVNQIVPCFVLTQVPAGGYVEFRGSNGSYYVDNITAAGGPVPVELVSFSARFVRNGVELNWHTATELNNYGFAIERSRDGRIWDEIDFVAGAGNSYSPKSYTYTDQLDDATRRAPRLAYRLRQIDRDGTTDYSSIVFVRTGALPTGVELHGTYPNPFNPEATISFTLAEAQTASLRVFDVHGREMALLLDNAEMQDGTHTVNFSGERLPSGVYIVVLQAGDVVRHQRIVLSK
jgi:hypothetical protein